MLSFDAGNASSEYARANPSKGASIATSAAVTVLPTAAKLEGRTLWFGAPEEIFEPLDVRF